MKRLSLWLFALAVTATVPAIAQRTPIATANVEALQKISNAAAKDYQANRSKALILAKERGWVIEKTYSNGAHVSLQGLDSKDLPIYYITYHNSRAAATTKTDQLWAGGALGLTLSGSSSLVNDKLGMWDAGRVRESHQELRGRITQKDNPSQTFDAHATHVAGTLMGSGVSQYAKGMAFGLKTLQAYDFNNDRSEMAAAAATGMLVSNHSYGSISGWRFNSEREGSETDPNWEWWGDSEISATDDYKFGYYDAAAAEWDRIAFNAPYYLMVKSAGNNRNDKGPDVGKPFHRRNKSGTFTLEKTRPEGISNNDGFDIIPTYGNAKNILTVGAVNPIANGYNQPSDVSISSFSSYGPTDDGRIKPDIVGNGVAVLSSTSATDITYSSYNGTSMSAPNVAGSVLLLQEHYSNLKNGTLMRAATLKGLVIHTADEAGAAPGPDYIYGWGLLNTAKAANLITSATSSNTNKADLIQENSLNPNQTYQLTVVASGAGPLAFTISWTDPEATVIGLSSNVLNNRTPRLVNDLDIRVSNGSNTFLPWTLNPSNPSEKAKPGDNNLDNVEQILIANAIPGETYTLTVSHKSILKENKKQEYSLIVSGIGGAVYCASKATSTTGSNIKLFTIGTYAPSLAADACTTYRNFASSNISFEPGQSQLLTIDAGFCGTTAPQKAKAFIDWNRDGDFADENEEVLLTGTGPFKAAIAAPGNVTAGEKILMRIVLQETADASVITACNEYARGETQDHYIQIIKQQSDIGVVNVKPLENSFCAVPNQRLLVKIRNFGAAAQTNFPVTAIVKKNGIQIAQLTEIYTGSLSAFSVSDFTMSGTFPVEAGASYEFVAETGLQTDGVTQNNKISSTLVSNSAAAAPIASAFRCGTNADYSLTSNNGNNTFWYTSLNATVPIAAGNAIVASSKINNNLFAAQSDFSATIGPANKEFATGGSYNQFSPDVLVTTKAAVVLESARLYIGNSGKITFTATTIYGEPVSSRTIDVKATRTTSGTEIIQPLDPADQGAVYYLGLELPVAGDYKISISYENGASIFRNNSGVYGYPFGITDVFTITGNTANPSSTNFYYYFYDLKVKALGCKSERVPVNVISGTPLPRPTIAIKGHTLESSETVGNNWYLNGVEIPNAKGKVFTPTTAGSYSVKVIKDGCISEMSVAKDFVYDPKVNVGTELTVYPNPSSGVFTLRLETEALEDITFEVYDLMGKVLFKDTIKRINGQFKGTVDFKPNASGVYLLRVQHGNNRYVKKLVVNK
jgi:hypothetical protein